MNFPKDRESHIYKIAISLKSNLCAVRHYVVLHVFCNMIVRQCWELYAGAYEKVLHFYLNHIDAT